MSVIRPLAAWMVLSLAAVTAIARNDPGPKTFPRIYVRHPLVSYRALADAPTGNGLELFALVAFIYAACIFAASWRYARRHGPGRER